jgi:hypothetical protein
MNQREMVMMKKILMAAVILFAGNMGWAQAQNAAHSTPRYDIRDRIQYQKDRVQEGLTDHTITPAHARYCLATLEVVENHLNNAKVASVNAMTQKEYNAYNHTLDANSAYIHESKQAFYYHEATLYSLVKTAFNI